MADRVGQQLGNYHLLRLLGRGGQAEVYLGEHRYLKSFAALKVLHASLDDQHSEQFLAEAQTLARLVHPSIVRVLDFTVEQGTPVLIMDYSPSGTMRQRYPVGTCLPLAMVVSAVSQVASALQYAHTHHVIHRDVKPENLLLGSRDEVLLSDFGLSVFAPSPELLSTQAMAGTLPYMAPEQLQGHPCFASDQYSLAIVAYEWLTGKRPFTGSQWQLIQQQLYATPPSLRELNVAVPLAVEAVVRRALAKDPHERYVSVQGFAHALLRAREVALHTLEDAEMTAPLRSTHAQSQEEFLAPSNHDAHDTLPWSSFVQPAFTQDTGMPPSTRAPSSQRQVKTEREVSPSKDVSRQRLLAKVRAFWITDVLEHSLHGAALIALGLREQPDAIANPWHLVLSSPGEPANALPPGTSIVQVYDKAVGELLILGEPGSGKTTLLLELARTLLDRADRDEHSPMPVVFNLSSWAVKRQPLTEWLIEELNTKYQVPRKLGKAWVEDDQILPLLDGLDEVAPPARAACVEAINVYRLQHGLVPTVVCSRSAEYLAESIHVLLRKAVVVQPLTWQEIEDYLASAGESAASVHAVLRADPGLQELATTPLMLSVLSLAYHGTSAAELLAAGSSETRRRQVFEHYVERMLARRGSNASYTSQQTKHWLVWLARQLAHQSQTEFYIEWMQPEWLERSHSRQFYHHILVRLLNGLIGGLVGLLAFGLFFPDLQTVLIGGLVGLLAGFLIQGKTTDSQSTEGGAWSWGRTWHRFIPIHTLYNGLIGALLFGCLIEPLSVLFGFGGPFMWPYLVGLVTGRFSPLQDLLLDVPLGGLVGGLVGVLTRRQTDIQPVEVVAWSWTNMWHSFVKAEALRNGLFCGLLYGVLCGLLARYFFVQTDWLRDGLDQGISSGLVIALLLGTSRGLSSTTLERGSRLRPNEGMWRSARNSALVGVVGGVGFGVIYWLSSRLTDWVVLGQASTSLDPLGSSWGILLSALVFVLAGGLLSGLLSGGGAWIKHVLLRLLLWRAGAIPFNYPRFLDYAAERLLLRKVGGGYIFVHRLLLEYLASLDTTPHLESTKEQGQQ